MVRPRGDRRPIARPEPDLPRNPAAPFGAVSERGSAPPPERPVRLHCERVGIACRHGGPICRPIPGLLRRARSVQPLPDSELTMVIAAPAPDRPVLLDRDDVGGTCGHLCPTRPDLCGREVTLEGTVSELPTRVHAPGPERPVLLQCHREPRTRRGRRPVRGGVNLARRPQRPPGAPEPELAVRVVSPGPERPVTLHRDGVTRGRRPDRTRGDGDPDSTCREVLARDVSSVNRDEQIRRREPVPGLVRPHDVAAVREPGERIVAAAVGGRARRGVAVG